MADLVRSSQAIGNALRNARKRRRLKQSQLSAASGIRQATISEIERGVGDPKLDTIFALLSALELELTIAERSQGDVQTLEDIF